MTEKRRAPVQADPYTLTDEQMQRRRRGPSEPGAVKESRDTDRQIRALETEAFAAGDALQGYMCRVALGTHYTESQLNDESCLSGGEQREVANLDQAEARELCERVIRNAAAQSPAEESAYAADRAYDQAKDDALTGDA